MKAPVDITRLQLPGLTAPVADLQPLFGGGNNRIYRLTLDDGSSRILKSYFRDPSDKRNRLKAEYAAFHFLWNHGVRCIPEPLGCDEENGYALFEYIKEYTEFPAERTRNDVSQALEFIRTLHSLSFLPDAKELSTASEAAFSLSELFSIIDRRLGILGRVAASNEIGSAELKLFLEGRLAPAYHEARRKAALAVPDIVLDEKYRTLSPSDFGFHNAILNYEGRWIFQDFEYFGRDDPAKLIIDFELHPAMDLAEDLTQYWRNEALKIFSAEAKLETRLKALFPLYGIKWCIILLNEFVPEYRARRGFAAGSEVDVEAAERRQLAKAEKMIARVSA